MHLGATYKDVKKWDPVITKFGRRLSGVEEKLLSKEGQLTHKKHFIQSFCLLHVTCNDANKCCQETRSHSM